MVHISWFTFVVAIFFFHLSTAFVVHHHPYHSGISSSTTSTTSTSTTSTSTTTSSRSTNNWWFKPPVIGCRATASSDDIGSDDTLDATLWRLAGLTTVQSAEVQARWNAKQHARDSSSTLSWLAVRLGGLTPTQLAAIVMGHPPILGYDIETNLKPTVAFFQDAWLSGSAAAVLGEEEVEDGNGDSIPARLVALLCESPELLEYNVKKRLAPRLERVRAVLLASKEGPAVVLDEESLRAIATKTDSRFLEWLDQINGGSGEKNHDNDKRRLVAAQQEEQQCNDGRPLSYVVVSNLQSGSNIGNIVRSASIFGCSECVVVGQKRYRLTGDHGSRFDLRRHHLWSHDEARTYLHQKGVRIYGVEIMQGASPIMRYDPDTGIMHFPFHRQWQGAAFVMGNEGQGLSLKQREICDEFIFIPQTRGGTTDGGGSASLNVACAATVILQAYCTWADYPDAQREGEKFLAPSGESQRLRFQE